MPGLFRRLAGKLVTYGAQAYFCGVNTDEKYLLRCLELASGGLGHVAPNPLVGCVIVRNNRIIGEGFHRQYGGPHAEVNAVHAVKEPELLRGATVYVNLEPCAHYGKTPPCADLLIRSQVKRVVIGTVDPFEKVAGKGIEKLRSAGIEVTTGVLEEACNHLNRRFFTFHRKQRPYIVLKWAQSRDGLIAPLSGSKQISGEISRRLVHKWRSEEAAILVGKNTAMADDPQLNVRFWGGRDPVRIVLDRQLQLPAGLRVFDGTQPTLLFSYVLPGANSNVQHVTVAAGEEFLPAVFRELYAQQIQSVLVEGGAGVLGELLKTGLWDEARVFTAPQVLGQGVQGPLIRGRLVQEEKSGNDLLHYWQHD